MSAKPKILTGFIGYFHIRFTVESCIKPHKITSWSAYVLEHIVEKGCFGEAFISQTFVKMTMVNFKKDSCDKKRQCILDFPSWLNTICLKHLTMPSISEYSVQDRHTEATQTKSQFVQSFVQKTPVAQQREAPTWRGQAMMHVSLPAIPPVALQWVFIVYLRLACKRGTN